MSPQILSGHIDIYMGWPHDEYNNDVNSSKANFPTGDCQRSTRSKDLLGGIADPCCQDCRW